jgi:signal transduction histidine kinase
VRQTLRLALLFAGLFVAILVVHQQVRLQAAEFLLTGAYTPQAALAEWQKAGYGTRLLLELFTGGALVTLALSSLRMAQGHGQRSMASSAEALPPLTAALKDLKDQEATQRQEKRAAIAQVSEMRAIQSTILEGISSGVVTVDGEGLLATCNPAACAILDWRAQPPIGRPASDLFRGGLPGDLIDPAAPPRRVEFIWRPMGGQPKHLGLSLSPIQTPAGRLTAVLFTDLTQVKRLKRQVELRRHLAQLGEVSAGIAHEFRNNMGAVLGYARLIAHDTPMGSPTREVVDAMTAELTGMEHLIRDLLDFSRKDELNLSRVEPAALVRHAAEVAAADFDVEVTLCLGTDLPPLNADEARLRQGLINLVRNACEAVQVLPEGTARVTVTAQAEAGAEGRPAEWLSISVADNGPGVDDAQRAKIFLPFFTTKESGTGMGLPHVHKTVTAHGGDVTLIPTPGGGATFRLRLPTVHRRSGPPPEAPEDVL